jgi:N-acetylmuramoyl-L-alanine amidase
MADGSDGKVVVALPRIDTATDLQGGGQGLVRRWNVERGPTSVKLHLDLARNAEVRRRFLLPPGDGVKTYRYVIDLKATAGAAPRPTVGAMTSPAGPARAGGHPPADAQRPARGGDRSGSRRSRTPARTGTFRLA